MTSVEQLGISGAELKTGLQELGIPPSWFAEHCGVTMRTVVRWFDSPYVAEPIAEKLADLVDQADSIVLGLYRSKLSEGAPYVLQTYRTDDEFAQVAALLSVPPIAAWHRAVIGRVRARLREDGLEATIKYG